MKKDLLPLAQVQTLTAHISTPKKVRNLYSRKHSNATEESKKLWWSVYKPLTLETGRSRYICRLNLLLRIHLSISIDTRTCCEAGVGVLTRHHIYGVCSAGITDQIVMHSFHRNTNEFMFLWSIHPSRGPIRDINLNNDCMNVTHFTLGIPNPLMATHKITRLRSERESMDPFLVSITRREALSR